MTDFTRRNFLTKALLRKAGEILAGFEQGLEEARKKHAFESYFDSYESCYALALAYPDELLLETAKLHGINTEGRDKREIVKELFMKKRTGEYGF